MIWSAPATDSMFATNLADIGALLCRRQGKRKGTVGRGKV